MLITGASTGIGAATARRAVEAGHRVALAARSADKLEQLATELGGDERAIAVATDVTDFTQQEQLVARTLEDFGRLDVAFANAGFGAKRGFLQETPDQWRAMVLTNVQGAARPVARSGPRHRSRRRLPHPGHAARPAPVRRPPAAHQLGRRPPAAAR